MIGPNAHSVTLVLAEELERNGFAVEVREERDAAAEAEVVAVLIVDSGACRIETLTREGDALVAADSITEALCEGADARWLALRAAESLRARMVEVATPPPPPVAVTPPERGTVVLELGGGALFGTGGFGPIAIASLAGRWAFARPFALSLEVVIPWVGGELSAPEGTAAVRPFSATLGIGWIADAEPLELSLWVGVMGILIDIDARAAPPLEAHRELGAAWAPFGSVELALALDPHVALSLSLSAALSPIPMGIVFAGRSVGEVGPLFVWPALGLRWVS